MLAAFIGFLKQIFGFDITHDKDQAEPETPQETPALQIPHEWPFPSKPGNTDYLLTEMVRGVEVEGDHVFYFWNGKKRRHIRTVKGTETVMARHIVWWMEGRKLPSTSTGLTTNCGEDKCIKLSHLTLKLHNLPLGPQNRPKVQESTGKNSVHVEHHAGPPLPPRLKSGRRSLSSKPSEHEKGDRTKCITSKVYFENEWSAKRKARILNDPSVRGRGRKVYSYDCPMCDGHHLTKTNPKNFVPKKVGSW